MQRSLSSEERPGEIMFNWNSDEIFHVDLEHRDIVWHLPHFPEFAIMEAEGALPVMAVVHSNLDFFMRLSNYKEAQKGTAGPLQHMRAEASDTPPQPGICYQPRSQNFFMGAFLFGEGLLILLNK